jgi:TusA-related sulfurtransferase
MTDAGDIPVDAELDTYGMLCPMPIFATSRKLKELKPGQVLKVFADDAGILKDLPAWCRQTGNEFLGFVEAKEDEYVGLVRAA